MSVHFSRLAIDKRSIRRMMPHMDRTITSLDLSADLIAEFEREWIEAWNAHDIDRILSHYRDDVRFVSPIAARSGARHGEVRGRHALRAYFERGLARYPALHFSPSQRSVASDRSPCTTARSKTAKRSRSWSSTPAGRFAARPSITTAMPNRARHNRGEHGFRSPDHARRARTRRCAWTSHSQ